jgi:hypothetical protein
MLVKKAAILKVYDDDLQHTILKYVRSFAGDFPSGVLSTSRVEDIDGYTTFEVYPNQIKDKRIRDIFMTIPKFDSNIYYVEVCAESI